MPNSSYNEHTCACSVVLVWLQRPDHPFPAL